MSLPQREFLENTLLIRGGNWYLNWNQKLHILECKILNGLISVFYAWLKPLIADAKWVEILFEGAFLYLCSLLLISICKSKKKFRK